MLRTLPYYVASGPGADGALCGLDPGPPASVAGGGGGVYRAPHYIEGEIVPDRMVN